MTHDKIKAAARRRMAETGESYAAARRAVTREHRAGGSGAAAGEPERFAISYKDLGPVSTWADTLLGGGPAGGRIEVGARELRLRMADFKVDVPRASVRRVARSSRSTRGTIGVHAKGGRWLANGAADGLVEIEIDPPCYTERGLSTLFRRMKVTELVVSLVDPDGSSPPSSAAAFSGPPARGTNDRPGPRARLAEPARSARDLGHAPSVTG